MFGIKIMAFNNLAEMYCKVTSVTARIAFNKMLETLNLFYIHHHILEIIFIKTEEPA